MMSIGHLLWFLLLPSFATLQSDVKFDKTLSKAIERAADEQRQLMLYFTSNECDACKQLDSYFEQKSVQKALSDRYVAARVDINAFDGRACKDIYGVTEVPAIVIVQPDGKITVKKQGNVGKPDLESIILHGYIPEMDPEPQASADTPIEQYALQVGYFSSKSNADKLSREIDNRGYETRVIKEQRDGKDYYRVLVGNYTSVDYASTDLNSLKNSGFSVKVHKNAR